jgi:hypothetical protein
MVVIGGIWSSKYRFRADLVLSCVPTIKRKKREHADVDTCVIYGVASSSSWSICYPVSGRHENYRPLED